MAVCMTFGQESPRLWHRCMSSDMSTLESTESICGTMHALELLKSKIMLGVIRLAFPSAGILKGNATAAYAQSEERSIVLAVNTAAEASQRSLLATTTLPPSFSRMQHVRTTTPRFTMNCLKTTAKVWSSWQRQTWLQKGLLLPEQKADQVYD